MNVAAGGISPAGCFGRMGAVGGIAVENIPGAVGFGIPGHGVFPIANEEGIGFEGDLCFKDTRRDFPEVCPAKRQGTPENSAVLAADTQILLLQNNGFCDMVDTCRNPDFVADSVLVDVKHGVAPPFRFCHFTIEKVRGQVPAPGFTDGIYFLGKKIQPISRLMTPAN